MDFGFVLRATRKAAGLSQEQIAPMVNISRSTISKLERNDMVIKADDLLRWLQVIRSRIQVTNTTPIEAGVALVNGVDIVALTQMLTTLVGGFIKWF